VSSIDVPRHKVIVVCDKDDRVTVKVTDISASLNGFTWLYKQKGPPHLKDSGTADATVRGLSLWLGLSRSQLTEGLAKRRRGSWATPTDTPQASPALNPRVEGGADTISEFPGLDAAVGALGAGGGAMAKFERGGGFTPLQTAALPSVVSWLLPFRSETAFLAAPDSPLRPSAETSPDVGHKQSSEDGLASSTASFSSSRPERGEGSPLLTSSTSSFTASFGSSQGRSPDVRIKIKTLDINLHKSSSTMMSWLYRMLLSAFSETIRNSVEEAVVWTLKERLREAT